MHFTIKTTDCVDGVGANVSNYEDSSSVRFFNLKVCYLVIPIRAFAVVMGLQCHNCYIALSMIDAEV